MSRRTITLAILSIMTFVVAACSSPTAPRNDECRAWSGSSGKTCT
jgi:hypothetical protein